MSAFATGTGLGSWPGNAPRSSAEVVVGELGETLAFLPQLPARGIGADLIGRAGALLVDLAIDITPRGYRLVSRPGRVVRRAVALLGEDTDALEEAWETAGLRGSGHPVKVQAPGPVTLAAELELSSGHRAITDTGATRDLAASLAEGLANHRADLARLLNTPVVVQLDEPRLNDAVSGRLEGITGVDKVAALDDSMAVQLLDTCADAAAVHCRGSVSWPVLLRARAEAVALDATGLSAADYDGIAEYLDAGRTIQLGLVPAVEPVAPPAAEQLAAAAAAITDRIGLSRAVLTDRIGITPTGELVGATPQWARAAIRLARRVAEVLADDPEAF